jgi:hypothetical protein
VQSFRENMTVEIADNDFVEDRRQGDPPRSVRLVITLLGSDPELTWQVAQELSALVAGSTMAGQRAALESELQGATDESHSAADALSEVEERSKTVAGVPNPALESARRRLLAAQQRVQDATIGLRALGEQHVLKFEVVDPGRVPARPNPVQVAIQTFVVTLLLALLAGWLLSAHSTRACSTRRTSRTWGCRCWGGCRGHLPPDPAVGPRAENRRKTRLPRAGSPIHVYSYGLPARR